MLTSISKICNFFTDECKYTDFSKMVLNFITYQEIVIKKYVGVFSWKVTLKSKGFKKALVESCQDPAGIVKKFEFLRPFCKATEKTRQDSTKAFLNP